MSTRKSGKSCLYRGKNQLLSSYVCLCVKILGAMQLRVYVEFIYLAEPSKNFPDEINADFGFIMSEI